MSPDPNDSIEYSLERIADALEQIAMKPVILDGSHMDRADTEAMLAEGFPPEERVWQFLINFPKPEPYYEILVSQLVDIEAALTDTEPEEECVDVAEARRTATHYFGDGCNEPHGKPEEQLS